MFYFCCSLKLKSKRTALLINQVRVKKRHHFLVGTVKLQNTPAGEAASVRGKLWGYAEKGHKLHLKVKTNLFKKNYSVLYLYQAEVLRAYNRNKNMS